MTSNIYEFAPTDFPGFTVERLSETVPLIAAFPIDVIYLDGDAAGFSGDVGIGKAFQKVFGNKWPEFSKFVRKYAPGISVAGA